MQPLTPEQKLRFDDYLYEQELTRGSLADIIATEELYPTATNRDGIRGQINRWVGGTHGLPPGLVDAMEQVLGVRLEQVVSPSGTGGSEARASGTMRLPEEVTAADQYIEGATKRISVNAYERNPKARRDCIAHRGTSCVVCGFSFETVYGERGKDYIHVHHLKPLADVGEEYEVDPIADLVPVCPNCHAMIHKQPPCSIDELRESFRMNNAE